MKSIFSTFIFIIILFITGCNTNKSLIETNSQKKIRLRIDEKVKNNDFDIVFNSASPQANSDLQSIDRLLPAGSTSNRILLNSDYYLKLNKTNLSVDLPYYGTQQLPTDYTNGLSGYKFDSELQTNTYKYNKKKKVHTYKFILKNKRESITMYLKIYSTGKANLFVNSSHRTSINYDGSLKLEK